MPSSATHNFKQHNADQFYESFSEASPTTYYVGVGHPKAWPSEDNPPAPFDSVQDTEYNVWRHLLAAKRIQAADISYCIPRINWVSGVTYAEYNDQIATLYSSQFYVLTDDYNVYKCIGNANATASTIKPTGTSTSLTSTADGYIWKFMYSLTAPEVMKWLTTSYVPVKTLTVDDSSAQWAVQTAAVDGSIQKIKVTREGGNYLVSSGTLATATSTTVTLPGTANPAAGAYTGSSIFLTAGLGAGQLRQIVAYAGSPSYIATVSPAFSVTPDVTTNYVLSPTVNIVGNGSGATAYVDTVTMPSGNVHSVTVISGGSLYSNTNITITANTSHGTNATARVIHSPKGGHGSDPVVELGGTNVMLNLRLTGDEGGDFTANNDFRMITLIANPKNSGGTVATASTLSNLTSLNVGSVVGTFFTDEIIQGSNSGAQGVVVDVINSGTTVRVLPYNTKTFTVSDVITGLTSGATALVASLSGSELTQNTGKVLFVDNRVAIQRSADQIEDIRHTIAF